MLRQATGGCVFLWFLVVSTAGIIPNYNLTLTIRRNETGHLHSDVHLEHDSDEEWTVHVNNTPGIGSRWTQTILIYPVGSRDNDNSSIIGYEHIPDFGYYKLHDESKTWQEAERTCVQERAHLLVINTDREAHLVGSLMENYNAKSQNHWAGFHDRYTASHYVTITNETLEDAGFVKWRSSDSSPGHCGAFYYDSDTDYGLVNHDCSQTLPFACEKKTLQ
ncbi:hypothetical protein L9F63_006961 [Diploptera punctata]|uniref:C-type lectin domain-containing protein n=1 Tax=Diploptera punctata TaxID=6984 RepID=A0AAD7Z8Q4_DIPPU|nr:hypothetical protein L9F63_006961 [Diploptera punctata]